MTGIVLRATVTPDRWPLDAACDVALRLVLGNDGKRAVTVFPSAAKIAHVISFAGIGITWGLGLVDGEGAALPLKELRRYYGPPGNPPSPAYVEQQFGVALAAGQETAHDLGACWIPNRLLEARHLATAALDPEGMDNVAELPPQASVLVFGATWAVLDKARVEDDFLRGHVVAFVAKPGVHELRASYVQDSWMGVGTKLRAEAAAAKIVIG